jgi:hypothetical protein
MVAAPDTNQQSLSVHDQEELIRLVNSVCTERKQFDPFWLLPQKVHPIILSLKNLKPN